jgi:hypothetical protein
MLDLNAPEQVAHIGLIDVAELRKTYGYGGKVAGFAPGVAGQNGEVAEGGKTTPPPQKPDAPRGETRP